MPTKPKPEPHTDISELRWSDDDDAWVAIYKPKRFRVLFDGGGIADVIAIRDDSYLRRALLDATRAPGIVGTAECDMEEAPDTVEYESGPI